MNLGKIIGRAIGVLFLLNAVYGLSTGAIRFPGGRGGVGGLWLTSADQPTGFWIVIAVSAVIGVIVLLTDYDE